MSVVKRTSLEKFRLKRLLDTLARKEGRGTELISLYVPPGRQISEVIAMLRHEYGTAQNIKSDTTRKNVQEAIVKVQQRLKLFKEVPEKGLVIFCGAIPQGGGPGSERIETYVIIPPEPISIYLYRCDPKFRLEYIQELLREKETYGIMVLDSSASTFATLQGSRLQIIRDISSGIPGKFRAGGQSARRFERAREAKIMEYFRRIAQHANDIFLPITDLKGLLIGGPGPTKYDFEKGGYLHYQLRDKVIDTIDTAYVGEQGLEEIVEKAPEILHRIRYIEEKKIMQGFLYEIGHDTGLATYGESEVKRALEAGIVKTLIVSEDLDVERVTVKCNACDYSKQETMNSKAIAAFEQSLRGQPCPKCKSPALYVEETRSLIDDFAELAEKASAEVEVISDQTEEGQMLKKSFGGIAATLRFRLSG